MNTPRVAPRHPAEDRRPAHVLLGFGAIVCALWLFNVISLARRGHLWEPVRVSIETAPDTADLRVRFVSLRGNVREVPRISRNEWLLENQPVTELLLFAERPVFSRIEHLRIQVGERSLGLSKDKLITTAAAGRSTEAKALSVPLYPLGKTSRLRWISTALNWAGDRNAAVRSLLLPCHLPLLSVSLLSLYALARIVSRMRPRWFETAGVCLDETHGARPPDSRTGLWLGAAYVIGALAFLEVRDPFYFTQDDNYTQFLPVILWGCRSLEAGVFPAWNPHQWLGAPVASMGVYALTYPFTYLAYALAKYVLGNERWTLDVFCTLHLVAGYFATAAAAHAIGVRWSLAATAALGFALSGYSLVVGRGWYYMTPALVFVPLLFRTLARLGRSVSPRTLVLEAGLIVGLFFHAGNAQMWLYALMFWWLATVALAWSGGISWRRVVALLMACVLGAAVAMPLLLVQRLETARILRVGGGGLAAAVAGLPGLIVPGLSLPLVNLWNGSTRVLQSVYFGGSVFPVAALVGALALVSRFLLWRQATTAKTLIRSNLWLLLALVAWLLSLGDTGVLWSALALLPGFRELNVSFKLVFFVNLFVALAGAVVLERTSRRWPSLSAWCPAVAAAILVLHLSTARDCFSCYAEPPYPPVPHHMAVAIVPQDGMGSRVLSTGFSHDKCGLHVRSLGENFATAVGVDSLQGYDPLVQATPENLAVTAALESEPLAALQAYGVGWLLEHKYEPSFRDRPRAGSLGGGYSVAERVLDRLRSSLGAPRLNVPGVRGWTIESSAPLAFIEEGVADLSITRDGGGVRISGNGLERGGHLVLNALGRPFLVARADRNPIALGTDSWGRARVTVPAGARAVAFEYRPPWRLGLALGGALAVATLFATAGANRWIWGN